jgi:hypothetical protein
MNPIKLQQTSFATPHAFPVISYHSADLNLTEKLPQKLKSSSPDQPPAIPLPQKLLVGASAGILGTSIIYPIDLMKTRLQSTTGQSFVSTVQNVVRGGGLYRGFSACLIGIAPEKALKLAVNDYMRDFFVARNKEQLAGVKANSIKVHQEIISGTVAGFLQLFITVPYESVKIQMQMASGQPNSSFAAKSDSALTVLKKMGPVGMYRGFTATLVRDVPFCFMFFPLYANVKELLLNYSRRSSPLASPPAHMMEVPPERTSMKEPFHVGLVAGVVSGAISAAIVTPADMLKTRIQQKMNGNRRFSEYLRNVVQKEGSAALFKGWQARVLVIAPLYGIVSLAFEVQKQLLSER